MTGDRVKLIEVYLCDLSQDRPYLGALREGETVNRSGYFVRRGNRTVYPRFNRSLVVRIETDGGAEGWGETYGLVAPVATAEIILDLLVDFVRDRDPADAESIHDELYDLMRVRGYTGGFYLDALAAIDIALWDAWGHLSGKPVFDLLGGKRQGSIPAYVSGLPEETLEKRCELAGGWKGRGFSDFKFALPVADNGVKAEMAALRQELGADSRIAIDLHWALDSSSALELVSEVEPFDPWFLEAPVPPEEIEQLREVAMQSGQQIAVGEEWRTAYDARLRLERGACHIVQPEMGHTGITEFVRICRCAAEREVAVIPHATIGSGIFLAASLQVSAAMEPVTGHEFQHSILEPFRHFMKPELNCEQGTYRIPAADGIGVRPSPEMRAAMTRIPA